MVNEKLIKKYINGDCTPEEKARVEVWLHSTNVPKEDDYTREFSASKDRIWNEISQDIPPKQPKTIPLYKTITHYAAAACLAGALFTGGYFTAISNALQEHTAISQTAGQGKLQITFEGGRSTQIPGNQFELLFDGNIQLSNLSDEPKTIVCGNQTLLLEAGESYLLNRYQGRVSMAKAAERENIHPDLSRLLKGDFTIKVLA